MRQSILFVVLGGVCISHSVAQVGVVSGEWRASSREDLVREIEVGRRDPSLISVDYCGSDKSSHYFCLVALRGRKFWSVPRADLVVVGEFMRDDARKAWKSVARLDMRADAIAEYAGRDGVSWSLLGRRPEPYVKSSFSRVTVSQPEKPGSRVLRVSLSRSEVSRMLASLEPIAGLNPPCAATLDDRKRAERDCENAIRAISLITGGVRSLGDDDLILCARLAICGNNLCLPGGLEFADAIFDELSSRATPVSSRMWYGRFLACCPGREEQAMRVIGEYLSEVDCAESRFAYAWAAVWMSTPDAAKSMLARDQSAELQSLSIAIDGCREEIVARSRLTVPVVSAERR